MDDDDYQTFNETHILQRAITFCTKILKKMELKWNEIMMPQNSPPRYTLIM